MRNRNIFILSCILSLIFVGCSDDIDPQITDLDLSRVLSPIGLEASIRNRTTIELTWDTKTDVDHYVVEFSEDSLEFNTIIRTVNVLSEELPLQETFFGDTRYSARVKAISKDGVADSKWSEVTAKTDSENIFLPLEDDDIASIEVTLNWPANSEVTHFVINPGNVNRSISAGEKTNGMATIASLSGRTNYIVTMYSGSSQRGIVQFKTLVDPEAPNTIVVHAEDDISTLIGGADPDAILVLYPGDYTAFTGSIVINKSISIIGYLPKDKPKLHVQFTLESGVTNIELADVELTGDASLGNVLEYKTADEEYGSLIIDGCNIHDYTSRLVYGSVASKIVSFSVDNSILTDVDVANSGDFIDFRTAYIAGISVTNSTFDNCAPGRDFVRIDAASTYTATGLTSAVVIDHCTFYGVSNTQDRIVYVRFDANSLTVKNSLFSATDGYYTNQPASSQPTCSNNNYFNAIGFYTSAYVTNVKSDDSGNYLTLDPGFADAINGDFTVANQTLKDKSIGDPRWIK